MTANWKERIITPPEWAKDTVKGMYLFGSRSMAVRDDFVRVNKSDFDVKTEIASRIKETTDFDYAAPNSYPLRDRLVADGWREVDIESMYEPCHLMKGLYIKEQDKQTVQIIMRSNHVMFQKAWDSIDPEFWYRYIWKSSPKFAFSHMSTKDAKAEIKNIINQAYNNANLIYGWGK